MKLTEAILEARRRHDIRSVLGTNRKKIVCPLPMHVHRENTPSFSIFTKRDGLQYWRCHGNCGLEGDVVDLVGFLNIPGFDPHNKTMIWQALKLIDERYEFRVPELEKPVVLSGLEWKTFLPPGPEALEFARGRGLTMETIMKFRLGQSGHFLTIPIFEDGMQVGVKMRNLKPCDKDHRFVALKGSRQGLFNYDAIYLKGGTTFVVKGEIPCMLMDQLGFQACAPTGGEGAWRTVERWKTALAFCRRIVIGDNDQTGREKGEMRAALLNADLVFPPNRFKDIDDYILAESEQAIAQIVRWRDG